MKKGKIDFEQKKEIENKVKKQLEIQEKQTRNLLIVFGVIALVVLTSIFIYNSMKSVEQNGISFNIVEEAGIPFYTTKFPLYSGGRHVADYNVFLRTNPKTLAKIPFEGDLLLMDTLLIDLDPKIDMCQKAVVSIASFANLVKSPLLGIQMYKDEEKIGCGTQEEGYSYVYIEEGNSTKIERTADSCYKISVNNCEIIEGTERFMFEIIKELHSQ